MTTTPGAGPDAVTETPSGEIAQEIAAYGGHVLAVEPTGAEPVPRRRA